MSKARLAELRSALNSLGPRARGQRYPEALRGQVVAWVATERRRGRPWNAISKSVGLRVTTLQRWGARSEPPTQAQPVEVVLESDVPPSSRLSLVGPGGWRLNGLTLDDARQLLLALSC